jgi:5'-deoxynucleotidase YfbR-like HD superfamily hydrolase
MINEKLLETLRAITKASVEKEALKEADALRECVKCFLEAVKSKEGYSEYKSHMIAVIKLDYPHLVEEMEKLFILF